MFVRPEARGRVAGNIPLEIEVALGSDERRRGMFDETTTRSNRVSGLNAPEASTTLAYRSS